MKSVWPIVGVGFVLTIGVIIWLGQFSLEVPSGQISVCSITESEANSLSQRSYFSSLFTTDYWPARWNCGQWSKSEGWMYILSDFSIFLSYLSISIILIVTIYKLRLGNVKWILLLFSAFILLCGFTHLIDVVIFWEPVYRFSGFVKLLTGLVSMGTTVVLALVIPKANSYKSPDVLEKEAQLENLSKIAKIGNWELNLENNRVSWSRVIYQIHEIEPTQSITLERALEFYHPDCREEISQAVSKSINEGLHWDLELKIITSRGVEKWVRAIGAPIYEDKKLTKIAGLFQDIDDKKRAELRVLASEKILQQKVEERTRQLRKANDELEAFTYSVSHDLRAPLRAINGFSEALMEDNAAELSDSAIKYLNRIAANSRKMGALIDDLLEFSRMNHKTTSFQEVDLNVQIHQLVHNLFTESKDFIEIEALPKIYGDRELLDQVFTNLISNAVKYSSREPQPKIKIRAIVDKDHITVSISDNGVGFDMKFASKLFVAFQRLHSDTEFEGTGVGLALCSKIVSLHKGKIWADSKPGEGSTFHVKFRRKHA